MSGEEQDSTGDTFPVQASSIKKNGFMVIKGRPCKVVETSTSKTGKHGHAKVHFVAIDIFTGKKLEELSPSTHPMPVPNVTRTEYVVVDINADGYVSLMDDATGEVREDLKVPDNEDGAALRDNFAAGKEMLATVIKAMGEEHIMSSKESTK